ncbi:3-carboxy-cis,cis-muconate cycloisomerase [Devosia sp. WQ 349]|uniref:3-carboxy-cis,cis-muconate cycloisomerase n=1 Tax=Devosia sp. WQ 349K1 TaxID=2800329 RepID=UPI001905CEB9|nr:3-carboxy-cis,cis-muconate cycloisomerase [Devosia sp. WQ 349K1]MBK1795895.1 3-carboxy-cis,cis-muconate cycloisomerase [Devosia sp. WQ 349K1]
MNNLLSAFASDPEIEALLSSDALVSGYLEFEVALAQASAIAGFVPEAAAQEIETVLAQFSVDWDDLKLGMARDGVPIPALIKQLKSRLSPSATGYLHKGATSQDAVDTAFMLQVATVITIYEERISQLLTRLDEMKAEFGNRPYLAHTRMQIALASTWSAKLATWSEPLGRILKGLRPLRQSLLVIQLGGPVGDRTSFEGHGDAIARHMAEMLDLGLAEPWHSQRDQIVGLGNILVQITGILGKIGMDVALLAQNEIGAVRLTGGGSSSAMAHKSNPVTAEALVTLATQVAGHSGTLNLAMIHENERSGVAWALEWLTLPTMLVSSGASLNHAASLLARLEVAPS